MLLIFILIFLVAVAADSFSTLWFTSALHQRIVVALNPWVSLIFSGARTMLLAAGLLMGWYANVLFPEYGAIAGLVLLLIVGIKLVLESIRFDPEEKVIMVDTMQTAVLLAFAGSINTFFAGLGLGMAGSGFSVPIIITIIAVTLASYLGIKAGKSFGYRPKAGFVGLIAGIVVIFTASYLIFRILN